MELRSLLIRMGHACWGGSSGSGAWRCRRPVAANSPLRSYFVDPEFAAVASDLFNESMPD